MEYWLLGPVKVVTAAGWQLPFSGAEVRGLVVLLALDAGRIVSAARLIDALYDEPPRNVDHALQQLVFRLRRILAEVGASRPSTLCGCSAWSRGGIA